MASTSLRRQVDALRQSSSGTSSGYIQRKKGRPSLLLTPDQAADVDLSTVREAAVMGLQRLKAVDQGFSAFEGTLFSKDAENTLRDLQTKESNDRIDKSIASFLALLSPHFSSREAHVCLEYLIRHFKIYQYNVDAVVECCLPWHDTLAFARLVQLLSLKGSRWQFLTPVQNTGSPLPREAIARRCARDFGLLRFLCVSARRSAAAAAESSTGRGASTISAATATGRAKLFSFYAAVVVEALASLSSASEPLLRVLIPPVVHGLSAKSSPEYQMASYMILSALSGKGPLSPEVLNTAFTALICKPCQGGLEPSLLCALAVAQTQVGFWSKIDKDSESPAALVLPTAAFVELSATESLPAVIAGLAQKFDTTAFLWLLLQSYVQHLSDEGAEHGLSLTRLCTYPHWPVQSLPRLIRRLVDRLIKTYLTISEEAAEEGPEGHDTAVRRRRAALMEAESVRVLRVLGQRYPRDVDIAVGKIARMVSKRDASASVAASTASNTGEDSGGDATSIPETRREEALSTLLVSSFLVAELVHLMPLMLEEDEDMATTMALQRPEPTASDVDHASVMVAMEHPSGEVRARAVEQLARSLSSTGGRGLKAAVDDAEDLSSVLSRRLRDDDPRVVLTVTANFNLLREALLASPAHGGESDHALLRSRPAMVVSAAASAAVPWLGSLSELRPTHPVASAAEVLCGLLGLVSSAIEAARDSVASGTPTGDASCVRDTIDAALPFFLECLPGPHSLARVNAARARAVAKDGTGVTDGDVRAHKKALRSLGRAAIESLMTLKGGVSGDEGLELFGGLGVVLDKPKKTRLSEAREGKDRRIDGDGRGRDESSTKSKGLKTMAQEVCDILAASLARGFSNTDRLQSLGEAAMPGARWLLLEAISRSTLLASSDGEARGRLASLLATLTTLELRLGSTSPHSRMETEGTAAARSDLVRYLRVCGPHLPRPDRPHSLFCGDHLSTSPRHRDVKTSSSSDDDRDGSDAPLLGDVLVSVLRMTGVSGRSGGSADGGENGVVCEAASALLLQGYSGRPLAPLASIAIAGASGCGREVVAGGDGGGGVRAASMALCFASTFLAASAEALNEGRVDRNAAFTSRDVVAAFPSALLAVASDEHMLREAGLLFISTVASKGKCLCYFPPSSGCLNGTVEGAVVKAADVEDGDVFPPHDEGAGETFACPLRAPPLASVVELAKVLLGSNTESAPDSGELTRHLNIALASSPEERAPHDISEAVREDLTSYLVAWGARLGWRDPDASARLLECFRWATPALRKCGLPLLRHCLDKDEVRENANNARLLKLLLGSAFTRTSPELHGLYHAAEKNLPRDSSSLIFASLEAEEIFHDALRLQGQSQTLALEALSLLPSRTPAFSDAGEAGDLASMQVERVFLVLVEAGVGGAEGRLLAAAAQALPVRPKDVAAIISNVVPVAAGIVGKTTKRRRRNKTAPSRSADLQTGEGEWTSTLAGVIELTQALCSSSPSARDGELVKRRKGRQTRKSPAVAPEARPLGETHALWNSEALIELVSPLFASLPSLISIARSPNEVGAPGGGKKTGNDDTVATAEYALWLTMDLLASLLRQWSFLPDDGGSSKTLYDESRAGQDAETVLTCLKENPSPQTRNSALTLLSVMAKQFPAVMASRLETLLHAVCAAAAAGEGMTAASSGAGDGDRVVLRQTERAVQSIVPALRAHGAAAGVGAHVVVQAFVDAVGDAPVHARRSLFGSLVTSLGDDSLTIMSALLLRRAVTLVSPSKQRSVLEEDGSLVKEEFVHQMVHCSGVKSQVKALVGLVQACHRIAIDTADRCGHLSRGALDDITASLVYSGPAEAKMVDYMKLSLERNDDRVALKTASTDAREPPSFMVLNLRALSQMSSTEKITKAGLGRFLERVLSFVRDHLLSRPLLITVAAAAESNDAGHIVQDDGVQEGFLLLCEELLLLLRTLDACKRGGGGEHSGSEGAPSWETLQTLAYSLFETLQSLLSVPSFVAVTQELLQHQDSHLRRKALQMITRRLAPSDGSSPNLSPGEESLFIDMAPNLRLVATGNTPRSNADGPLPTTTEAVVGSRGVEAMDESDADERVAVKNSTNQQTALLSLDVLARVLGRNHPAAFLGVLDDVTDIVVGNGDGHMPDGGAVDGGFALQGSAFCLLATLCAVLGARAFPRLPQFFPAVLRALEDESAPTTTEGDGGSTRAKRDTGVGAGQRMLCSSALAAVATIAASLPSFLSPYLGRVLSVSLRRAAEGDSVTKVTADRVLTLLAGGVEARLLIPAVCGAYGGCVSSASGGGGKPLAPSAAARSVARLLAYVQEVVAGLRSETASAATPQLTRLLTQALDFRRLHASGSSQSSRQSANMVETEASAALVCLVMKMSEVQLRPLFLHLCEWKAAVPGGDPRALLGGLDRRLAFYRVLDALAASLKSIFSPYFAHVLGDMCEELEAASRSAATWDSLDGTASRKRGLGHHIGQKPRKKQSGAVPVSASGEHSEEMMEGELLEQELRWRRLAASRLVLSSLRRCFLCDRSGFVDKARFELLLPAVVSQIECGPDAVENEVGPESSNGTVGSRVGSYRAHARELVGPCLAQLAAASGKDALWKALANAVLMHTRSTTAGVRVGAMVVLRQCFEVVGDEFLALLPEFLPFLSELLEDGHPEVESECRGLVKYIEEVLGESIESFLT